MSTSDFSLIDSGSSSANSNAQPQAATSTGRRIDPYYLYLKLPKEEGEHFIVITPFVPVSSNNRETRLVSFLTAKSDPGHYGELRAFTMPQGETVKGPVQVNSEISRSSPISQAITLLNQQGSRVTQGSLQLIPVGNSLLYVRPFYAQGRGSGSFPQFQFVVVWTQDFGQAVCAQDVNDALNQLFVTGRPSVSCTPHRQRWFRWWDDDNHHLTPGNGHHHAAAEHHAPHVDAGVDHVGEQHLQRRANRPEGGRLHDLRHEDPGARRHPGPPRHGDEIRRARPRGRCPEPQATREKWPDPGIVRGPGDCYYLRSGNPPFPRSARHLMAVSGVDLGKYKLGWSDSTDDYVYTPTKGLNEDIVREISHRKSEPEWMTKFRLNALKRFERKPMLEWFATNMPDIDFDDIYYYLKPTEGQVSDWDMLPESMKKTYEKLGIPEAERKFLAGVTRTIRMPSWFDARVDDRWHAADQGAGSGRRGVLARRVDARDRASHA